MPTSKVQQNFTKGAINPKLLARSDAELYYSGARDMKNVISIPYGGFSRRLGTKYIETLPAQSQFVDNPTIQGLNGGTLSYLNDLDQDTVWVSNLLSTWGGNNEAFNYDFGPGNIESRKISIRGLSINSEDGLLEATVAGGIITDVTIVNGGQGYDTGTPPIVTITDSTGINAVITTTVTSGVITGFTITNGGSGYSDDVQLSVPVTESSMEVIIIGTPDGGSPVQIGPDITVTREDGFVNINTMTDFEDIRMLKKVAHVGEYSLLCKEFNVFEEIAGLSNVEAIPFVQVTDNAYIVILSNENIDIYKDDALIFSIAAPGLLSSYIPDVKTSQFADTAIFVQENMKPKKLFRISDTSWTFEDIEFDGIPFYNFNTVEQKDTPNGTITPSALEGTIDLTLSVGFSGDPVGQYVEGNGGRAKILEKTSNTKFVASVVIPFYSTAAITQNDWTITNSYEPVWSEERGYPRSVAFYQNRLWFGGTKSRRLGFLGSKIGLYYNFLPSTGYNNDAIDVDLSSSRLDTIINIFPQRTLQIFASGAEYAVEQDINEPITPTNISIRRSTQNGSWNDTEPVDVDGVVLFIEKTGRNVINFVYDDIQRAYTTTNESLLNSHLIEDPVDMSMDLNNKFQQASYLYIAKDDGDMTVACILLSENVTGYTLWETKGDFKSICVLPDSVYFIVERNGSLLLEKQVETTLDSMKEVTSGFSTTVTGLGHLEGDTVSAIIDGDYNNDYVVSGGEITLDTLPTTSLEVGLDYEVRVEGNPIELPQAGPMISKRKRIAELTLRLYETENVVVNGEERILDKGPTEDYTFKGLGYWTERDSFVITQNKPLPLTVLGVEMEISYEVSNG